MTASTTTRHGLRKLVAEGIALPLLDYLLAINRLQLPAYISIRERLQFLFSGYDAQIKLVAQRFVKRGDVVADIGAHVGLLTRPLARIVGREGCVYAFEPDPTLFSMLEYNTGALPQVRVQRLAISDRTHTATFHLHPTSGMSNSLVNAWEDSSPIEVQCASFDDWVLRNSLSDIRLIKIDVEGAEPLVLRGMRHTLSSINKPCIVMEFCPKNLGSKDSEKEVWGILENHSYKVHSIDSKGTLRRLYNFDDVYETLNENGYVNLFAEAEMR
jgi:FkbM family methyltransferase